ncbi:MAG: S41 family peptidase [Proteobacteria bacterium]|jgi:carboxyl-terminal processing protease|nr:S41 family peptidase [Pseudomonadota bacterium]
MPPLRHLLRAATASALLWAAAGSGWASTPQPLSDELLGALQGAYTRAVLPGEQADRHRDLLATVLQRVQRSHATEADFAALVAAATKVLDALPPGSGEPAETFRTAMNAALRSFDNYARYLDAQAYSRDQASSGGSFVGLGIEVETSEAGVRITAPMPGGPAARAGLRAGDLIVQVDDKPLRGVALADAIARMRGDVGTQVSLVVRREGSDDFTLALTRDTIRRQLLRWRMEGDALVLRLSSFSGPVASAMADAIAEATAQARPRAVVLDLRGNPGGLIREAVRVADTFLSQGAIASMRGRTPGNERSWQADSAELLAGLPMVVLQDKSSASASELVAAALQENGRATVMGQRSFGKGSVQTTYALGEGRGAVKLTSALYYGPLGRTVNKAGVTPDVELLTTAPDAGGAPGASPGPALQVAQGHCGATGLVTHAAATDAALSCALAWLRAGSAEAFAAAFAGAAP